MSLTYRDISDADRADIAVIELRKADKDEILAMYGPSCPPNAALLAAITWSSCVKVIIESGHGIICVWGTAPTGKGAMVWAVGTRRMYRHKLALMKFAKKQVKKLRKEYGFLFNYVSSKNTKTIKWLRWMGFTVEAVPRFVFHDKDTPFHFFFTKEDDRCVPLC